jgi:hypothetical protein
VGGRDPLRALAAIEAADAARELDELPSLVLPVLAEVLGADTAGWTAFRVGVTQMSTTAPFLHSYPAPLYDRVTAATAQSSDGGGSRQGDAGRAISSLVPLRRRAAPREGNQLRSPVHDRPLGDGLPLLPAVLLDRVSLGVRRARDGIVAGGSACLRIRHP